MLVKSLVAAVITLAVIGTTAQIIRPPKPILFYNPSPSATIGWYRLRTDHHLLRDTQVAAYAPQWARVLADERGYLPYDYPLIKSVWAAEGDEVCYYKDRVSVPNRPDIDRLAQDVLGRDMPVRSGCVVLKSEEYLLISPDVQSGFDSRYFGPVGLENILGPVELMGNFDRLK